MTDSKRSSFRKSLGQLQQVLSASWRPLPKQTGDGTYITPPPSTGLIDDLPHVTAKDAEALIEVTKSAVTGDPQNDRDYIMERVIQVRNIFFLAR
jgi:hypothetical protein